MLGPLEVLSDGRVVTLGGKKQRVVLALLLLGANRVVPTGSLIDGVWEEEPPDTAQKALQVYVSQLRKLLGRERLETKASGYLLRLAEGELDLARFQELRAERKFAEALSLWRGPPLSEFAHQRFAQAEIARLEELRLACVEDRIQADLASSGHADLVGELEALVHEHPFRQRLRVQLMLALYRAGREAEALEVYRKTRSTLVEELGIEPGRELRDLEQRILQQDPSLDAATEDAQADSTRGVFVGREHELAELYAGLDDAFAGHGRLFLLVGEPGIGKSRLAEEIAREARIRGAGILVGRCWEAGGAPAYWPWLQALREYARVADPEGLRAQLGAGGSVVAQLLPELRELVPDLREPPPLEAETARFRLFESVASFLKRAAASRLLVLVLDDLHAADEPSLLLLQFLARELAESRLLVVCAYRDVDPTPADPLTAALAELVREPVTRSLALAGLGEDEVARYIEVTAGVAADDELTSDIYEETEGNPLFVGEIVRLLATEGGLGVGAARIAIPQSVRDVIARRLRNLSEECNRTLVLASVLGREFSLTALSRLAGVSEDDLLETLDEAMAARVVADVPDSAGQLRFAHVLIRDTLYEGLTTARRVRLHRLAMEVLESLYGDSGAHLAELAHHAIAGSDFEKALVCAQQAAERALRLLAFEEAARLARTALDSLELARPGDDRARCILLLLLGEAELAGGNAAVSKETFLEAAGIARRLGLSRQLAHAAIGYAGRIIYARAGPDTRLVPLLEEALEALGEEDLELRVRMLSRLAGALRDEALRDRRDRLSREAVELARSTGDDSALAYALDGRGAALLAPDAVDEIIAIGTELFEVATRIGDPERAGYGLIHRFIGLLQRGDITRAEADLRTVERLAGEHRQASPLWQVAGARAMLSLASGRLGEAEELSSRALEIGEHALPWLAVPVHHVQHYTLCDFRGDVEALEQPIREMIADYPARPIFRCVLAHLQMRIGQPAAAKTFLDELCDRDFSGIPFDMEWTFSTSLLAEITAVLDERASAATLYELLAPWADQNVANMAEGIRGSVARYLGLLAATLERWEEAAEHFERALAANERMGLHPWLAHTQSDYARMLRARDHAGDPERARELLEAARTIHSELGMQSPAAKRDRKREQERRDSNPRPPA